jgi:transposase InsO family protein
LRKELEKQVKALIDAGALRPSKTPWVSSPHFVKKSNGDWRLTVDYRRVNQQMVPDVYPLAHLWTRLAEAGGYAYYSVLDLQNGFFNIPLAEQCRQYTGILTHIGVFEFTVLPFGLRNSPAEFQRCMDEVLVEFMNKGVFCFVDDIVIYSNDMGDHINTLRRVLETLCGAGLFIKLSKAQLVQPAVKFLGHLVSARGVEPAADKIQGITEAVRPRNKEELRSFLGTSGYLQRYIPSYSRITAPLTDLLKAKAAYVWDTGHQTAFEELKRELSQSIALSAPRGDGPFILTTDASDRAAGAVLAQKQDGEYVVLECASKKFDETQQRWDTREREFFAIKWALLKFQDYLRGSQVVVYTDHASLKWIDGATSAKIHRWALIISQFNPEIRHIAGKDNMMADWLSRSTPESDLDEEIDTVAIPVYSITESNGMLGNQRPYLPTTTEIKKAVEDAPKEDTRLTYVAADGLRYSTKNHKMYVPPTLRDAFMFWIHGSRYGGHMGINRTIRRLQASCWWPGLSKDVTAYVTSCLACCRHQPPKFRTLKGVLTRPLPFQLVSLDHVGPRSWTGRTWYFLVIIDHASRFIAARATLEAPTSANTIHAFKDAWIGTFGAPDAILTDRGPAFNSTEFRQYVTGALGAYHILTSAYYPQGNSVNESCHRGLGRSLACAYEGLDELDFPAALADAVMAHNASPLEGTGESPFSMLFGMEPTLPGWQQLRRSIPEKGRKAVINDRRMRDMMKAQVRTELIAKSEPDEVEVGDIVVYSLSQYEQRRGQDVTKGEPSNALAPKWSLPCKVLAVKDKTVDVALTGVSGAVRQVPFSMLRILKGPITPTMMDFNYSLLEKAAPRVVIPRQLQPQLQGENTWRGLLKIKSEVKAVPVNKAEEGQPSKKKQRPTAQ